MFKLIFLPFKLLFRAIRFLLKILTRTLQIVFKIIRFGLKRLILLFGLSDDLVAIVFAPFIKLKKLLEIKRVN